MYNLFYLSGGDFQDFKVSHIDNEMDIDMTLNKSLHHCPIYGKIFYENNPFTIHGTKYSIETVYNVLNDLKNPAATFSYVA